MSTGRTFLVLVAAVSFGAFACDGDTGPKGPPGDPGTPAPTTGTLAGLVTDGIAGDPLAGVTVTAQDLGGAALTTATTGADGLFELTVTAGPIDLAFAKPDYTPPGVLHTGVQIGATVHLAVTMNEAASGKPSVSVGAPGDDLGYGAIVSLVAAAADPNGDALAFAWTNTTAPVLGTVEGSGAQGTLTLPTMAEAFAYRPDPTNPGQFIHGYVLPDRFGIIPIIPDTRGQVTATLVVTDGRGQSASASITLSAASPNGGVRNAPIGQRIYVNSGHDDANAWTLTPPAESIAVLDDAASRTPSFVIDKPGLYVLAEGAHTLAITGGSWRGMISGGHGDEVTVDAECRLCHGGSFANAPPDMFTPWLETGHATFFTRGINGGTSDHYSSACFGCHTVGYDDGVANGGFDDVMRSEGWTMAALDGANWDNLVEKAPALARLANIQCENCHGPQLSSAHIGTWDPTQTAQPFVSPRISYAAEACATCHGAGAHHIYSEWATVSDDGMGHANRTAAQTLGSNAAGMSASCGRCHTAQGYTLYAGLLDQGKVALNSVPPTKLAQVTSAVAEPVTCIACHDPHDARNPNQLRFYGDTPNLPGGFAGRGMGKGALCITCHNSRNGAQTGSDALTYLHEDGELYNSGNPTGYSAPHQADQGDVFTGHNAYFLGASMPMLSRHAAIADTCVGCHMTLQPRGYLSHGAPARSGHLFAIEKADIRTLCANCHGATVDGAGIQAQVEAQLAALDAKMGAAVKAKVAALGGIVKARVWDPDTDYYSSSSSSTSNVVIDTTANPIAGVRLEEIHGQVGLVIELTQAITVPFVTGTGAPAPAKDLTEIGVQLGAFKTTGNVEVYALTGNFVRAGWNYFLVEGDGSEGLHNPTFVLAVLNASLARDLSN